MKKGIKNFLKSILLAAGLWFLFMWLTESQTLAVLTSVLVLSAGILSLVEDLVNQSRKTNQLIL
ncbi:hypothetical protein ACFSJ3_06325 [Corallincola platygyrae]|uniref:Uncharacterized protein n=1 Tax=Corallincola platygyrae TaxID=1193278 RepID=A0ABW4XKK4_9GAMM